MVSSWTYALVFVCSQYATKTIAKEFNTKKTGEKEMHYLARTKNMGRTKATKGNRWASGVLAHREN